MNNQLNNDVLSIISIYSGIPIKYVKNKLKINVNNKCESCNKRMRRTSKSIVEAYTFPKLWEIDNRFYSEQSKYIRTVNTFVLHNKIFIPYDEAYSNGLITYQTYSNGYSGQSIDDQIYGNKLRVNEQNIKLYVKKAPSLSIMYKALREILGITNENLFLDKLKEYNEEGLDENIMNRCIKQINIINKPEKIVVRLCGKCRKKLKQGYIFT